MGINDFSSLLQLAAGLNAAYIAVDYSTRGYTQILSNKLFEFPRAIDRSFQKCEKILCEKETLNNLNPLEIVTGKSTSVNIEEYKRNFEILEKKINEEKVKLKSQIEIECEAKHFSFLSLCMFLFCTTSLFLGGLEKDFKNLAQLFFCMLGSFLLIFIFVGWTRSAEKIKAVNTVNYSKLSHAIFVFLFSFILSLVLIFFINEFLYDVKRWLLLLGLNVFYLRISFLIFFTLFPFVNFVVFLLIVRKKGVLIHKTIVEKAGQIEAECNVLKLKVDNLVSTTEFVSGLIKGD